MIRINLLGVERQKTRKALTFDIGAQLTLLCSLILVVAALGIGWWYWSLTQASAQLDQELAAAQQEAARLQSLLGEVQQFEQRRGQLQQRVALIEQLRRGQSAPVQLLDHVSRSMPDTLWLTDMEQTGKTVTINGRSTTLIAISDFIVNLTNSPLLKKPVEIVNSQVEAQAAGAPAGTDVIKFSIKAQIADPAAPAPAGTPAVAIPAPPGAAR
jgi:type IV pilus assembly protein PilN